jgi:hypothetical protein
VTATLRHDRRMAADERESETAGKKKVEREMRCHVERTRKGDEVLTRTLRRRDAGIGRYGGGSDYWQSADLTGQSRSGWEERPSDSEPGTPVDGGSGSPTARRTPSRPDRILRLP